MDEVEFDKFAAEYRALHAANVRVSGEGPEYFAEYKVVDLKRELDMSGRNVASPAILDFGAGVGYSVPFLRKHLPSARITCLDVSRKSLDIGAAAHGASAEFQHFDGAHIPYADGTFDAALASCVFHHIPHEEHVTLLAEIRRVLKPGGILAIFEHNPLNPLTRHAVNTCVFDEHAELMLAPTLRSRVGAAGFRSPRVAYRLFVPGWLRPLRPLERWLTWLPLGAQYYVVAAKDGGSR